MFFSFSSSEVVCVMELCTTAGFVMVCHKKGFYLADFRKWRDKYIDHLMKYCVVHFFSLLISPTYALVNRSILMLAH